MKWKRIYWMVLAVIALVVSGACASQPVDRQLGFQALLTNAAGAKVPDGDYEVIVSFWNDATSTDAGDKVYEDTQTATVTDGMLNIAIPDLRTEADALNPALFSQILYAEITIDGETLSPRQKLLGTPYAFSVVGGAVVRVDGTSAAPLIDQHPNLGAFNILNAYSIDDPATPDPGTTGLVVTIADATDSQIIRACSGATTCVTGNVKFAVLGDGQVKADGAYSSPASDFAELVLLDGEAEAGDVLVISPTVDRAVILSTTAYDAAFAGVYSTDPGFIGGSGIEEPLPDMIPLAITGIVPVKVTAANGPITRGALLTTSDLPGHAMLATEPGFGTVIGKAMGELLSGEGVIEVLLLSK